LNEIDEIDRQVAKHDEQRISILKGTIISELQPKYRIDFERDESRMNDESTMKCEFAASIEIEICEIFEKAEPSIKSTSRGIVIDLRAENENTFGQCGSIENHSQMKSMNLIDNTKNMMNKERPRFDEL
jgi:hypothetical protein